MGIRRQNLKDNYELVGVFATSTAFLADLGLSTATEGMTYYDTTDNVLKCYNGSSWVAQGTPAASAGLQYSLSQNAKGTTAMELEVATSTTPILILDNDDATNNPDVLNIENAGSGSSIDLETTGTGKDIDGTSSSWYVEKDGDALLNTLWIKDDKALMLGTASGGDVKALFHDGAVGTAGNGLLIDAVGADEQIQIGDADYSFDVWFVGNTATTNCMKWDIDGGADSVGALVFNNADLDLGDNDMIRLGDGQDITFKWDGSDLLIDGAAANTEIKIGASNNQDVGIYGGTATNYWLFDTDDSALTLDCVNTGIDLHDGTSHFTIGPAASNALPIDAGTANETINIGATTNTDVVFHGGTAGRDLQWDASANTALLLDNAFLKFGTGSDITLSWNGTDMLIDGAAADTALKIGATNNQDLYIYAGTATSYVHFDTDDVAKLVNLVGFGLTVGGTITGGANSTTQGKLVLWDGGGGNTPAYVQMHSPDGTAYYLFFEDDGTLKVHTSAPTANADGDAIGDQTD